MIRDLKEIVFSGIFAFVTGFVLWPPRDNYWMIVDERLSGDWGMVIIIIVLLLSIIFGFIFGKVTDVRLFNFISGGVIMYLIGMWLIEIEIDPISPVHLLLYGLLLATLAGGVVISKYNL